VASSKRIWTCGCRSPCERQDPFNRVFFSIRKSALESYLFLYTLMPYVRVQLMYVVCQYCWWPEKKGSMDFRLCSFIFFVL
jgi:hypothetical protein